MSKFNFRGLSREEVEQSRQLHGTNELPPPLIETFWEKLIDNFQVLSNFYSF
jgi:magnesium-transporting ATPase (P-type)